MSTLLLVLTGILIFIIFLAHTTQFYESNRLSVEEGGDFELQLGDFLRAWELELFEASLCLSTL